jgi:hypothetical protein
MGSYFSTCVKPNTNENKNIKPSIIIWDIENIGPPDVCISDLVTFIRLKYITECDYTEHSTICSLTNNSMKTFDALSVDELVSVSTCVLLASTFSKKRDADFVLKREMMRFISHNNPKQSKIILITGDSDFSGIANMALQQGFDFQLVHNLKCGKQLLSLPYLNTPIIWDDLVCEFNNGIKPEMKRIHYRDKGKVVRCYKTTSTQTETKTETEDEIETQSFDTVMNTLLGNDNIGYGIIQGLYCNGL